MDRAPVTVPPVASISVSGERPAEQEAKGRRNEQRRPRIVFHGGPNVRHHAFSVVIAHVVGSRAQTVCCRGRQLLHSLTTWEITHSLIDSRCGTFEPVRGHRSTLVDFPCCCTCHVRYRIPGFARSVAKFLTERGSLVRDWVICRSVSACHCRTPLSRFHIYCLTACAPPRARLEAHPRGGSGSRIVCGDDEAGLGLAGVDEGACRREDSGTEYARYS